MRYTEGCAELQLPSDSIAAMIDDLKGAHPNLHAVLFGPQNELNSFVNIYHNQHLLNDRLTHSTPLQANDKLEIVIAVSGG